MSLLTRLQDDMKQAMKAGEKDRLTVIRMLISDVKNIDLQPNKITEEQAVAAYAKKLKKSAEEYEKIGKPDEVAKLKSELAIVESYLPKKAGAEDTEKLVDAFLAANSFTEKQMGQAMGLFIKQQGGNVDPAVANALLKKKLTGK
jgi:uncharacterized protein